MDWASLADTATSLISNYGLQLVGSLILGWLGIQSGFLAYIVKWIIQKGGEYLIKFIKRKASKADQKHTDKENAEDLQKVIDSPNSTESDVIKAGEDLLNGVKKPHEKTKRT